MIMDHCFQDKPMAGAPLFAKLKNAVNWTKRNVAAKKTTWRRNITLEVAV